MRSKKAAQGLSEEKHLFALFWLFTSERIYFKDHLLFRTLTHQLQGSGTDIVVMNDCSCYYSVKPNTIVNLKTCVT